MARVLMTTPTRGVMRTRFSDDPKQFFATNKIILVPNGDFPSLKESCTEFIHLNFQLIKESEGIKSLSQPLLLELLINHP